MAEENIIAPDHKEREDALDHEKSFIVQAPAGSGKTELLIMRCLTLLAKVQRPEELLAITFTRKAAGEMHSRLLKALSEAAEGLIPDKEHDRNLLVLANSVLQRDQELGWNILENPARLKVRTIDSVCLSITAQTPILSHAGSSPAVTGMAEEFYREAARRTTALVEAESGDGEAARNALIHMDYSLVRLEGRIIDMLKCRDHWLRYLPLVAEAAGQAGQAGHVGSAAGLRAALEEFLKKEIEIALERAAAIMPDENVTPLIECGRYAACSLHAMEIESPIRMLEDVTGPLGSGIESFKKWRALSELLTTQKGDFRKTVNKKIGFPTKKDDGDPVMKERFSDLLKELAEVEGLAKALADIRDLPSERYSEDEWEMLGTLLRLLPIALKNLAELSVSTGDIDFTGISLAAISTLGAIDAPSDLMLALDLSLSHILVDEFQDTSRTHYELLERLISGWTPGDGRTLFLVGDPMQSIYLFRDAEVGLFLEARSRGIGSVKLEPITLTANFRSYDEIVGWVNESFKDIFPRYEDRFLGAVTFAPSVAIKGPSFGEAEADVTGTGAGVSLNILDHRNDGLEAEGLINDIVSIREERPGESVAVLCRSRNHLAAVIEGFKARSIDFTTRDFDPLSDSPVVLNLFALLRILRHPLDRVAWLSILRAPWCGLSLADMHILCGGPKDRDRPLLELLRDPAKAALLSEESRVRLARLSLAVNEALEKRGRVGERVLLEGLWLSLGGPAALESDDELSDAEAFLDMIGGLEGVSIQILNEAIGALSASRSAVGENPVQVMTVHKAKGLEFQHIFLPGLGKGPGKSPKRFLTWLERDNELLLAPMESVGRKKGGEVYAYIKKRLDIKEENEKARLLYVAATRAIRTLHLYGNVNGEKRIARSDSLLSSFGDLVSDCIVKSEGENPPEAAPDATMGIAPEKPDRASVKDGLLGLKRITTGWEPPTAVGPPEVACETIEVDGDRPYPVFEWAEVEASYVGTVVHEYLRRMAEDGVSAWDEARVDVEFSLIKAGLRGLGLADEMAFKAAHRSVGIIKNALADEWGRFVLSDNEEGRTEFALSGVVTAGGPVVERHIDRTFIDNDGTRWIVDYKTGSHKGGDLEGFLEEEVRRYRGQMEEYRTLMEAYDPVRKIKCALYYPALKRLMVI